MLRLVCGNLNYSSWSIRPWLALKHSGLDFRTHDIGLRTEAGWKERILSFSGAGQVPVLVDGPLSIHESLAICEYVSELAPAARLWPEDRQLRARGRAISCEMHSGFSHLRNAMDMNLRARARRTPKSPQIDADIARVLDIWGASLSANGGPFLLGEFSTLRLHVLSGGDAVPNVWRRAARLRPALLGGAVRVAVRAGARATGGFHPGHPRVRRRARDLTLRSLLDQLEQRRLAAAALQQVGIRRVLATSLYPRRTPTEAVPPVRWGALKTLFVFARRK